MTMKYTRPIVQVIIVISILSAVHFIHILEPETEDAPSVFNKSKKVVTDIPPEIADTLAGKDKPDYSFPDMHLGYFTENQGQWEDHIGFIAKTSFGHVGLGDDGVFYYLSDKDGGHVIKVNFQDAEEARPFGREDAGFSSNYFHGNDHNKWVREARNFEAVVYENVWPGIDILYYFTNGTLKYDIVVDEYTDPGSISFFVEGHSNLEIGEKELTIYISEGVAITDSDLIAFYDDGTTETIEFKKLDESTYGFEVDKIEGRELTIDPMVFSTSTFLGGSGRDSAKDMALDGDGNIIILSETFSNDFPNTTGAYKNESAGTQDLAITKMDPNATYLIFSTYIGGWHMDFPYALDVDDAGDIYATGETWATDFPTTNGSFCEDDPTGSYSVFVVKLSSSGSDLIYSTYVGSTVSDWARDIEVFNGFAYVVGYTYSYDFPFVEHPIDNAHGTAFLFILNQDGSNLTHTDFWGGHQNEMAYSLEIDTNGDAVVGGVAHSVDFPTTSGVYQEFATDNNNAFLLRFRPSTHTLIFSTFIGGTEYDIINSIHLDSVGDIYFSGRTNKPGSAGKPFPTTPGAYDRTINGSKDAFIGKMSSDGTNLLISTFIGGEGEETVGSIDMDSQGNIYFTGSIDSGVNFTVTPDAFDGTFNNDSDAMFLILKADGSDVLYSTYLGGIASDTGDTCLLGSPDEILLLVTTASTEFPSTRKA
jgi:hypothetical protein